MTNAMTSTDPGANDASNIDLQAAWIRRSSADIQAFVEGLAVRLEGDLPGQVDVVRKRDGLFAKTSHVQSITVRTEEFHYLLDKQSSGVRTQRARVVGGVILKRDELSLAEWMQSLLAALFSQSGELQRASQSLHDFLMN